MSLSRGICVNHHCGRFEHSVAAVPGDRCIDCGQLLCHESGLTWEDAAEKARQGEEEAAMELLGRPSFRLVMDGAEETILYSLDPGIVVGVRLERGEGTVEYDHPVYGWKPVSSQFRTSWEKRVRGQQAR